MRGARGTKKNFPGEGREPSAVPRTSNYDAGLAIGERHGERDATPVQWPRLGMMGRVVVERAGSQRLAHWAGEGCARDRLDARTHQPLVSGRRRHLRTTEYTGTGCAFPFSSIGARSLSFGGWRSARFISSVSRISPPSAAEHRRAAMLTASPMTANSSRRSDPMF